MKRPQVAAAMLAAWVIVQGNAGAAEELVIIPAWPDNPFYRAMEQGCRDAGRQIGTEWSCALQAPAGFGDVAHQRTAIEDHVARGTRGIAVEAADARIGRALENAQENGVRILTFLSDADDPAARAVFIDSDEEAVGRALGVLAVSQVTNASPNRPNTFAIVMSLPQSAFQTARADAVRAMLGGAGATEIADGPFPCAGNPNDGRDGLIELSRRSDIGVVVAVVDCSGFVNPADAFNTLTRPTPTVRPALVTACLDPAALANVGQDGVDGMVCEQPAEIGRLLMETFHTIATGGSLTDDRVLVPPVSAPPLQ